MNDVDHLVQVPKLADAMPRRFQADVPVVELRCDQFLDEPIFQLDHLRVFAVSGETDAGVDQFSDADVAVGRPVLFLAKRLEEIIFYVKCEQVGMDRVVDPSPHFAAHFDLGRIDATEHAHRLFRFGRLPGRCNGRDGQRTHRKERRRSVAKKRRHELISWLFWLRAATGFRQLCTLAESKEI